MEDLESELSVFIVRDKSCWIFADFRDGESNCVPGRGYFASLFKLFFFPSGKL